MKFMSSIIFYYRTGLTGEKNEAIVAEKYKAFSLLGSCNT